MQKEVTIMHYNHPYQRPSKTSSEVGKIYEKCIASYLEQRLGCLVVPQGILLGKHDGGIDLIGIAIDKTYVVQCKNYSKNKSIYEDVTNQLAGSANTFRHDYGSAKNVIPLLAYTCNLSDAAQHSASVNNIQCIRIHFHEIEPAIGIDASLAELNISEEEYKRRLGKLIESIQSPSEKSSSKSFRELFDEILLGKTIAATPVEPEQTPVELEQNPAEPKQNPVKPEQVIPEANASAFDIRFANVNGIDPDTLIKLRRKYQEESCDSSASAVKKDVEHANPTQSPTPGFLVYCLKGDEESPGCLIILFRELWKLMRFPLLITCILIAFWLLTDSMLIPSLMLRFAIFIAAIVASLGLWCKINDCVNQWPADRW